MIFGQHSKDGQDLVKLLGGLNVDGRHVSDVSSGTCVAPGASFNVIDLNTLRFADNVPEFVHEAAVSIASQLGKGKVPDGKVVGPLTYKDRTFYLATVPEARDYAFSFIV